MQSTEIARAKQVAEAILTNGLTGQPKPADLILLAQSVHYLARQQDLLTAMQRNQRRECGELEHIANELHEIDFNRIRRGLRQVIAGIKGRLDRPDNPSID